MDDKVPNRTRELFSTGYYWAESILLAIAESRGIESELIPKIATGFCSGVARTSGTCGAVSGAILAINLVTGRSEPGAPVDDNYAAVRKLIDTFQERFGSTSCGGLLGCHLGTEEGQRTFREKKLFANCLDYAEEATRITLTIIEEMT